MANDDSNRTHTKVPPPNPHNVQADKHYIFNETGNIMLATTDTDSTQIEASVREVFAEVSVFFAAMTKAMSETKDPHSTTGGNYSLYNYEAMSNIIDGSGLFVHVTEEDILHKTTTFGVDFSRELVETILGLATGAGEMSFASGMIASMGKEGLKVSGRSTSTQSSVANIVFVCEYLLGMPVVSAIVVSADMKKNTTALSVGPCFKEHTTNTKLRLHKDTYLFVTPKFIKQYASDLSSVESDPAFAELILYLKSTIDRQPLVTQIAAQSNQSVAVTDLTISTTAKPVEYIAGGINFGEDAGTLTAVAVQGVTLDVVSGGWNPNAVTFQAKGTAGGPFAIELRLKGTAANKPADFSTAAVYSTS